MPKITIALTKKDSLRRKRKCDVYNMLEALRLPHEDERQISEVLRSLFQTKTDDSNSKIPHHILTNKTEHGKPLTERDFHLNPGDKLSSIDIEALLKLFEELAKATYEVVVQNSTDDDLLNLTITYYQNQAVGGKIVTAGPFSKSLAALPAGENAGFNTCPCLAMADNYIVSFGYHGRPYAIPQNIPTLNSEEQAAGSFDFCGDSLEVFFQ